MIDETYFDILNKVLDNTATLEEKQSLTKYMNAHPEETIGCREILEFDKKAKSAAQIDPPADLKDKILKNIDCEKVKVEEKHKNNYITEIKTVRQNNKINHIFTFATGLAAGICLFLFGFNYFTGSSFDGNNQSSGSLLIYEDLEQLSSVSQESFDIEMASGSIRLKNTGNIAILEYQITSQDNTELHISYNTEHFKFMGFTQEYKQDNQLITENNEIVLSQSGQNHYLLFFKRLANNTESISYEIIADGDSMAGKIITDR